MFDLGALLIEINKLRFRYWKTWDIITENQISGDSDTLRNVKISKFLKLLQILKEYHRSILGFRPMSNYLTKKEVHNESIESIKNLAGLSPNQFEKKIPIVVTPW